MIVNVVSVHVKPEFVDAFVGAIRENHVGSRQEPGNFRFDVLQSAGNPSEFLLYEVFASAEAVEIHRSTPHYLAWKAKVEPWMAKPREGRPFRVIAPENPDNW